MKKKKKKKAIDKVASEIVEIVAGNKKVKSKKTEKSKDKTKSKSNKKSKVKSKSKAFTTKEIKSTWKEMSLPSIITTKEVTMMVEKMTGYKLGTDLTAGAKNLRRYLRTLDRYDDDVITHYRWSIKDTEDLDELAEIMAHYSIKAKIG